MTIIEKLESIQENTPPEVWHSPGFKFTLNQEDYNEFICFLDNLFEKNGLSNIPQFGKHPTYMGKPVVLASGYADQFIKINIGNNATGRVAKDCPQEVIEALKAVVKHIEENPDSINFSF